MNKREEKIASRLQEAQQKRTEAEEEMESYRRKNSEFEEKQEEMFRKSREEAESQKKELLNQYRREVDELRTKWHEAIKEEKESFLQELRKRTGKQVCTVARQALSDLSDAELEQRMIHIFIRNIRKLDKSEKERIKESTEKSKKGLHIMSAFEIPSGYKKEITREIHKSLENDAEVRYDISPNLICGIELKTNGDIIAWNLDDYLRMLEEEIENAFERRLENSTEKEKKQKEEKEEK
jgi:F-type H+-transporting ATPase subunit b